MKPGFPIRSLLAVFGAVVVLYFSAFHGIEYLRHRKGPWEIQFATSADGVPFAEVRQPALRISSVRLVFPGEVSADPPTTIRFERPVPVTPVPFGRVLYEDLTFLPGVVTLDLFGHEIELVPRTLMLNRKAIPWRSGAVIEVSRDLKPARPPQTPAERVK